MNENDLLKRDNTIRRRRDGRRQEVKKVSRNKKIRTVILMKIGLNTAEKTTTEGNI